MKHGKDYWVYKKGDLKVTQCVTCVHNRGNSKCDAFPDGIPEKILLNKHDHKKPYNGDHGIRYEHL